MKKVILRNELMIPEVARLVSEGESVVLRTKGCSMLPFIRGDRDDVVLVRPDDVKVLDIVLAEVAEERYVIHRVVDITDGLVTLMGDGNLKGCEKCRMSDILALAVSVVKDGKTVDCRCRWHRIKARIWILMRPLRRYILSVYRRIM